MKKLTIIYLVTLGVTLVGCGDKGVTVQDIQTGVTHITNITNSKNASEVIANVAHVASDIQGMTKQNESSTQTKK